MGVGVESPPPLFVTTLTVICCGELGTKRVPLILTTVIPARLIPQTTGVASAFAPACQYVASTCVPLLESTALSDVFGGASQGVVLLHCENVAPVAPDDESTGVVVMLGVLVFVGIGLAVKVDVSVAITVWLATAVAVAATAVCVAPAR